MKKSRILFLEAPYYYAEGKLVVGKYFPLGISYLAAYLRKFGYEVKIFQPSSDDNFENELVRVMDEFQPTLAGISVMTPTYPKSVSLCDLLEEKYNCATVLGGHHISAVQDEVLVQSPNTDFAIYGEGEETLLALVEEIDKESPDYSCVDGLIWRDKDNNTIKNKKRDFIADLNKLPFPARDLVDMSGYKFHSYLDSGKISTTMITSRGCPYKCMFCSSWLAMGMKYRYRSVENIIAEVKEVVEVHKVDHILFEDDTMTLKRERVVELCEALLKLEKRPSWYCLSRVDSMDLELAKLMKRAGCNQVGFGIESGSEEVLKKIKKRISIPKAIEAVKACTQAGLKTQCTFIVGFPYDTYETMEMTLKAALDISPTIGIFFPLTPYPGTEVFNKFLDKSLLPKSVAGWDEFIVTSNTSGISVNTEFSEKELSEIADRWNRKFYFRPKQWINMARTIGSPREFYRLAVGALYLTWSFMKKMVVSK